MERPPDSLKSYANHLAELAALDDGSHLIRLLQLTGMFAGPSSTPRLPRSDPFDGPSGERVNSDRVGIWERKSKGGKSYFGRSTDMANEWNMWANVGRIEPKGAKRRVVLIGESVARGYLYDPVFTPALVLEKTLKHYLGEGGVEVIDLARLSLLRAGLLSLAGSALMLEPDALVIFAGNNWGLGFSSDLEDLDYIRSISAVSREHGVVGLKRFAEQRLMLEIEDLVREVASIYQARGIPVVWMIPGFNLGDWRDAETNAPYLKNGANREWLALWDRSRNALRNGDLATASELAGRMVELDEGVSVAGLRTLAECSRLSGDRGAERGYLERARDALIWDNAGYVPSRSYSVVQDTLRSEPKRYNNGLVDLPLIFNEHLGGELPDRRLFVDHCHLTSDGIRISMAAAAACLLQLLTGADLSWSQVAEKKIPLAKEVEAEAAFLAAVHNAHWWQAQDLVEHFCLKAVQNSPKIARMMTLFGELQTKRSPMLMSRSAEQFAELGAGLTQFYTIQYNKQLLDRVLLDAIGSSLGKFGIGERERLERLQLEEHSVIHTDNDLLDYYYCSASRQPKEIMWAFAKEGMSPLLKLHSDYYKAYSLESRFAFVGESDRPVELHLTCRLPGRARVEEAIAVEVNGYALGEMGVGSDWGTWDISVGGDVVRDGLNEVSLRWPQPEFPDEEALRSMFDHLVDDGIYPEFYPVFGEVHSFVASDGRKMRFNAEAYKTDDGGKAAEAARRNDGLL